MSLYHSNQGIREEIDRILKSNAKRQSNLGTESTEDEIFRARKLWANDLIEISKLDSEFAKVLEPNE
jgi:hypothetical protein